MIGFISLAIRLYYIQIVCHQTYVELAAKQHYAVVEIAPRRGDIVDRNGDVLATSTMVYSVYCEPNRIKAHEPAIARRIASIVYRPYQEIYDKLMEKQRKSVVIARQISFEQAREIESVIKEYNLNQYALFFRTEGKRTYPYDDLLAPVLGYVVLDEYGDNRGMSGLEYQYDEYLRGGSSKIFTARGGTRVLLEEMPDEELEKTKGCSLELTIDRSLQYIAERELRNALVNEKADAGAVVVLDIPTGEVLAMVSLPSFNPNNYKPYPLELRRNNAISAPITPGSSIKVFTYSTLLQHGLINLNEIVDCGGGRAVYFHGRAIRDVHPMGIVPIRKAFSESSNVGTARLAERLPDMKFYKQLETFGFGQKTGIDLPGEDGGLLYPPGHKKWSAMSKTSWAIGYEIAATALQLAHGAAAIANNGYMMKPYVVRRVINAQGEVLKENKPQVVNQVVRPAVTQHMLELMEEVVRDGTGKRARIPGYRIGGKTGTARKVPYSEQAYISSFVGVLPLEAPKICIYVWIDNPRAQYLGGQVAAPVFKNIAEAAIKIFHIQPSEEIKTQATPVLIANEESATKSGGSTSSATSSESVSATKIESVTLPGSSSMPDLTGLSMREALKKLAKYNITPIFVGSGVVIDQSPLPGTEIKPDTECILVFGKLSEQELAELQANKNK